MPDYIKMFVTRSIDSEMYLVSELIIEEAVAEHFANCVKHNYNCITYVRKAMSKDGYVVFADNVDSRLVRANISPQSNEGLFANWKFETRNFNRR